MKDGNGFISRISADGVMDSLHFIQGGRDSVQLDSPMGSRVQGDTLWVLDVDKLRGFDTNTGKPYVTVDLSPLKALFLNDLAIDSTGEFYITDTGVQISPNGMDSHPGPDRILHVAHDRSISVAASTALLSSPDGIAWDQRGKRFVLAPFAGPSVQEWRIGDPGPKDVAQGKGSSMASRSSATAAFSSPAGTTRASRRSRVRSSFRASPSSAISPPM